MKRVVVRYRVKADRVSEHEELIRKVFAELAEVSPEGIRYEALRLEDGVSFLHVASVWTPDGTNPLGKLASFKAFTAGIDDRCDEKPKSSATTAIGSYVAKNAPTG